MEGFIGRMTTVLGRPPSTTHRRTRSRQIPSRSTVHRMVHSIARSRPRIAPGMGMRVVWRLLLTRLSASATRSCCTHEHRRRSMSTCIRSRVNVLRTGSSGHRPSIGLHVLQQPQPRLDHLVVRIQVRRSRVRINRIANLIVARFVKRSQVEPDFGDVRIDPNRSGIGIEGISVLVDVVIKDADGTPECGVATVPIDGLLVGLIRFLVFLDSHIGSAEKVPALRIAAISLEGLCQTLYRHVLIHK